MNDRGLFITGTGTDVGKTFASGFLLAIARSMGKRALYYKPIQCGPVIHDGVTYLGGDVEFMHEHLGHPDTTCTWSLRTPTSPHFAFAKECVSFETKPINDKLVQNRVKFDFVVMEGAGGIRTPITDKLEMTDIAKISTFPVLVVAQPGLGTINHTLLTLEHLSIRHLPIAGFVFCHTASSIGGLDPMAEENAHTILARSGIPFLGHIPCWVNGWPATSVNKHPLRDYLSRACRAP